MKQSKQVIRAMENNGGYATLGYLYQNVNVQYWKTKTPFASIRRIVQDSRFFFKIRPGLWALNDHRDKVLEKYFRFYNEERFHSSLDYKTPREVYYSQVKSEKEVSLNLILTNI